MDFGKAIGTACSTFAITNIDDLFVLVTFFAETAWNESMTPLYITLGQYLGFSIITSISMLGYGLSLVLPAEPIGFLGLLPILVGVWHALGLLFSRIDGKPNGPPEDLRATEEIANLERNGWWAKLKNGGIKSIFTVAAVTIMNGGDNIGTYTPLFSQAKGAEIAIYVVVYYILLGIWILAAWLVMKQRHILRLAEKWAGVFVPFLYMGLGTFIVIKSECFPWSIEKINAKISSHPGTVIMGVVTAVLMLTCIATMVWIRWRGRTAQSQDSLQELEQ
ncbi:hypothetical protein BU24DRAFT_313329, partial [Aaosphaeria arxii CBS 175.79]